MLARLPLRTKLILVVSIPLLVILGFGGFGISDRLGDLDRQRQYGRLRGPNDALVDAQRALENEGVLTTWFVASKGDATAGTRLDRARDRTNVARREVRTAEQGLAADDVSGSTRRSWRELVERMTLLDSVRRQANQFSGLPSAFAATYSTVAGDAIDVSARLAHDIDDRQLTVRMLAIVELRREQAAYAAEAMVVIPYLATGTSTPAQLNDWIRTVREQEDAADAFVAAATPDARSVRVRELNAALDDPLRDGVDDPPTAFPAASIAPETYYTSWRARQAGFTAAIAGAQRAVNNVAAELENDALRDVLAYGLGVAVLVVLVLVLALVVTRSVNRSLHRLTGAARDVAENRLPHLVDTIQRGGEVTTTNPITPLTVESKDEIGALAQAFNTIQETTVRVAEQQAALLRKGIGDLYVNLARRNQSLVDRQIALLDVLEARTEDPDQLGSLFELDHLATRMRRNAESLLVLSGAGQPRQWTEAIPILDVVRAASGEIADFARISFVGFDSDVAVAGNAVADVTHILAELLENATAFSPPGTPVVVAGMLAEHRFVVSITDEGIGMDDARLAAANALLQHPPLPGLALSRTLGLHVVAHLASRYGVRVQLRRSAANGVTAIVALPSTVLTRAASSHAQPAPPPIAAPPGPPPEVVDPVNHAVVGFAPPTAAPMPEPEIVGESSRAFVAHSAPADVGVPMSTGAAFASPAPAATPPAWHEPEIVPPTFDPDAAVPPAATPVDPVSVPNARSDPFDATPSGLPRRGPNAAATRMATSEGLPHRDPGSNLSAPPDAPASGTGPGGRRRPERVHDLLTQHLRGIRDGRGRSDAPASPDQVDAEEHP